MAILEKLNDPEIVKKMGMKDITYLWKILRTERNLPATISMIGEDPKNKFNSLADALNAISGSGNGEDEKES